jgi:hypothetical protein
VPAPGEGPGYWAGASSAALDENGTFVVAYRVRHGHDGAAETVIARSEDGEEGCDQFHLDMGYARHDAHGLSLSRRLDLACHHLSR